MTNVLHDDLNLMRCTLDAHELGLKFVINLCYYISVSPNHRVLTIGALTISAKSNNLRLPACIQRILNATNHGSNVFCCMTI
jgi:hypothetical protein